MMRQFIIICLSVLLGLFLFGGCATLPENVDRQQSYVFTDTADSFLGQLFHDEKAAHPDLAFGDLDVLCIGPVAEEVSESFDRYRLHESVAD